MELIAPQLYQRIRLLGQILGQVIRDQAGEETFAIIEELRRGFSL